MFFWPAGPDPGRAAAAPAEDGQHSGVAAALSADAGSRPDFERCFPLCENISIDFAVLEKTAKVSGIPAGDFGWNDVGSWNAVYELLPRDAQGNVVIHDSVLVDSHNNFVDARGKIVALLGVQRPDRGGYAGCPAGGGARSRAGRRRDPEAPGKPEAGGFAVAGAGQPKPPEQFRRARPGRFIGPGRRGRCRAPGPRRCRRGRGRSRPARPGRTGRR